MGSGIRSGGFFGIQIGRWSETHTSSTETTQPVPARITSTHGKVDLDAEGKIHATTTYIYGKDGVTLAGADILLDGSQGFTPDIGFNAARGKTSEKGESWTPTLLNGDHVSIEAGGDLNIDGSFVMGKKVDVNVGGNMRIASRQNSYSYHAKNSAIGGGVSLKSGGASLSKDQRDYSLRTVAEQAGIFAGKEGLTVTVKGKTTLVGAVIDSQGKKEKNQVTTGDLELQDMDNVASLTHKGGGVGYQSGQGTKVNEQGLTPMPVIGVDSKTKSKTYAAIVDGKLEITGNKKIKVEDINRNTQHTLNALENSLNLRKLEERKRLSTLFAKHANEAIHVISEKNKWKEGSPEKVLLHAFVGGMTAQMGGDTVLAGAIPGAVNEIFSGALQRYEEKYGPISPDQRQWLALVGGVITNYATGHTLQTGGAVAAYGTKHNFEFESIKKQCEEKKAELFVSASQKVSELKEKGIIKKNADGTLDLGKGNDFIFYDYSFGLQFAGISTKLILDRYGQIYASVGPYIGCGMSFGAVGYGILATSDRNIMDKNKFQTYIEGNSAEFSATGAIGGDISIGEYGPMVALRGGAEVGLTAGVGHSFYLGSIIQ